MERLPAEYRENAKKNMSKHSVWGVKKEVSAILEVNESMGLENLTALGRVLRLPLSTNHGFAIEN